MATGKTAGVPTEHQEQVAFFRWFRMQYPDVLIWATPNGGSRHPLEARNLKAEGVIPGVPDIFIPEWRLFIEMKRRQGGVVSMHQREVMAQLADAGYECHVCKGFEEAAEVCRAAKERNLKSLCAHKTIAI